jgi:ADP-ribose pyrophosphatase
MEELIAIRTVYSGDVLKLRVDKVRLPGGSLSTREIIEHRDCVCIVPVDASGNILLVKQFRAAVGKTLLEIPAGSIDAGEAPEQAASREMREETGFRPQRLEKLGGYYASPGYCTEFMNLFLAKDLVPDGLHAEDTEEIEVVKVSQDKIMGLIKSGGIQDAKSVAGLLLYLCRVK